MRRRSGLGLILALALAGGLQGAASPTAPASLLARVIWQGQGQLFGGVSAIETEDGQGFIALSDRGGWVQGRLLRDARGRLTGVEAGTPQPLLNHQGDPLARLRSDSEGLARAPDGTLFVSFEGAARVLRYDRPGGLAQNLPLHPDFRGLPVNAALEALAIDAQGRLYTLPEAPDPRADGFPVYRFRDGAWQAFGTVPQRGEFRAVSADIGPDGRFYLLERQFAGLAGFASRLRRFEIGAAGLGAERVLMQTGLGTHGNLEGLAVWRDAAGELRATMVADNNFSIFFPTELVEYQLPD